jgi:maltokinase
MIPENRAVNALQQSIEWAVTQRWFGDKARPVTGMTPELVETVDTGAGRTTLVVARFSFEWGADSLYFIPVGDVAAGELPGDAALDASFLQWFVDGFAERRTLAGEATWSWRTIGEGLPSLSGIDYANVRPISGEQSNTSIVFDRRFIGKLFRRVQAGLNPDLEIGEFLSTDNRFPHAPKLYGLVEVQTGDDTIALAAMQEFVLNHADGWTWLLAQLRELSDESLPGVVDAVRLLARRTAELHIALASDAENPAFAPEIFGEKDADALIGRVVAEIEESVEGLARQISPSEVEQIHKAMGMLMGSAHALVGTAVIRVHGDYHLGQTLRTLDDDFMLIDFEGEPSRTMDQRRMKQTALKDVAGMVRSLDYAAATVLMDEADAERRQLVRRWFTEASEAFVDTYRWVARTTDVPIVPASDTVFTAALNLMIAEKALYEVRYELNNRPDWLNIPLNALRELAGIDIVTDAE